MALKVDVVRAQAAAWKLYDTYGFSNPRDLPLPAIARDLGVKIRVGGLRDCEARLIRAGSKGIIRLKSLDLCSGRSRFAISHELGHWKLHGRSQGFVCSAAQLRDYKGDPAEAEANLFAAELLMLTHFVKAFVASLDLTLETALELANECNVSLTAAAIRIAKMTTHECVLVYSSNRHVQWWVSTTDRFGVWLKSQQRLQVNSAAYHTREDDPRIVYDDVAADVWLESLSEPDRVSMSEESIFLKATNGVLTLLVMESVD